MRMGVSENVKTGLKGATAYEQGQGTANISIRALAEVQEAFQGVAEELGIEAEQDVVAMVKEVRAERARENLLLQDAPAAGCCLQQIASCCRHRAKQASAAACEGLGTGRACRRAIQQKISSPTFSP